MHLATRFVSLRAFVILAAALASSFVATAMPTVTNLNGDVLNYQENQDQNVSPALVDVGGNAVINMGFIAGRNKFQFQFTGGNSAEDSFYFGNYGTGAGQVIVGLMDDGTGSLRNCVKVSGGIVGSWDPATNTIVFTSTYANNDTIMALVRNLRYSNSAQYTPSTATRTVRLSFTDWVNETYNATTTINVTAVDDPPAFLGAGFAATDFGVSTGTKGTGYAVAPQADGKYIAVYEVTNSSSVKHLVVARFNFDGTLDPTFGTAGLYHSATVASAASNNIKGVLIRTDAGQVGKILVSTSDSDAANDASILLLQLNANGTLDTTFGSSGLCRFNAGTGNSLEEICAIAQQADGKIVAAGSFYDAATTQRSITLWRFKADGSGLDTTFASPLGYARTTIANSYSYGFSLFVQPDGKIVLGGLVYGSAAANDSWDIGVRRYNADGSLDTAFGSAGMAKLDYAHTYEGATRVARQSKGPNAGKIIVAGNYATNPGQTNASSDLLVARLNPDGSLDTSFGSAGWAVLDVAGGQTDTPAALCVDSGDRIVVTGKMGGSVAVVRLTADGALDTTFNTTGKLLLPGLGNIPTINGAAIDPLGKIMLIGSVREYVTRTNTHGALVRLNSDGSFDPMGNKAFVPGQSPIVLDPDLQVFDGELATTNYAGASVTLSRHGGANTSDVFGATGTLSLTGGNVSVGGTTIGTFTQTGGTLRITFNTAATTTLTSSALRQITYSNSAGSPPSTVQIDWVFADGNTSGAQGTGGVQSIVATTVVDIAVPKVSFVVPSAGPVVGGTVVTLTGRNFTGATSVKFGATSTSFTVNSDTTITTIAPPGSAGTVDVTVTANGTSATGPSDRFTYAPIPALGAITPAVGPLAGGTTVTITGTSFGTVTAVKFGGTDAASFYAESETRIIAVSPAGAAGTANIVVTTGGGVTPITTANRFTYIAAPAITGLAPTSGSLAGGTSVTISGTALATTTAVRFGTSNAANFTVNSDTSITATTPAGAPGPVDVVVTTVGGSSTVTPAGQFTYAIATYADWASSGFTAAELTNPAISGANADPDGAGLTNLLRYALDLPARGPVSATTSTAFDGTTTPATLALSFTVRANADDLLYEVQSSPDLAAWTDAASYTASGTKRTELASVPVPTGAKRFFLRLRVAQIP
jgi:uncharacterized delta-60 repeat protein